DVRGRPILGDEPGRAGRPGRIRGDPARAGDQQHVQPRGEREQLRADLRARLLAHEQAYQRDLRPVAPAPPPPPPHHTPLPHTPQRHAPSTPTTAPPTSRTPSPPPPPPPRACPPAPPGGGRGGWGPAPPTPPPKPPPPRPRLGLAELHDPAHLQRLQGRQPQP